MYYIKLYIYWFINIWYLIYSSIYTFFYILYTWVTWGWSWWFPKSDWIEINFKTWCARCWCSIIPPGKDCKGWKKTLIVGFVFFKHIHNVHSLAFPRKYKFKGCLACVVSCKGCVPCGWWDCFKQCVQHVWHWATKWNPSWI